MPEQFSTPLAKPPAVKSDTPEPDDRPYHVSFHREVAKIVTQHGVDSGLFRPTIGELITALENQPSSSRKSAVSSKTLVLLRFDSLMA